MNNITTESLKEPKVNKDIVPPKTTPEYEPVRNYGAQGSCCERDRD